jgi:tetratricopeptide (TPR) repeat protein
MRGTPAGPGGVDSVRMRRRPGLWVFLLALLIRLVYLAEIRDLPWFEVPIVDGANYARLAQSIARGSLLGGSEAYWQPPLYSYFLAIPFALFGPAMLPVYVAQAILGALSCALASAIAAHLHGRGAGLATGLIMALYGPLIHFDAQPLIPVLHIALILGGLLIMVRAGCDPMTSAAPPGNAPRTAGWRRWAGAGALWGLAAVATPNILLAVPVAAGWVWRRAGRAAIALLIAGAAVPVALVAARNLAVAGEPVLISSNGGINFYIGNNPDYDRTVRARPGGEFERIAQEPENAGISGAAARSRWFAARGARFLLDYPGDALRLYARKALDLVAGREIPRNENMYDYRGTSLVLRILLWRAGLGFPFGVIAPLALAGALLGLGGAIPGGAPGRDGRAGTALLFMVAGAYAFSVLLFFPTDRYRLPLVPVAAILAGRMLVAGAAAWRRPAILAGLLGGLVLFNLDAAKAQESWPEEAALNRAYALRALGRPAEAKEAYREAAALNPRRLDPPNALAAMAAAEGDWPEAEARYHELVALAPDFVEARTMLGRALAAQGRTAEAREQWVIAAHLAPGAGLALAELALSWLDAGVLATAFDYGEQAVRARPDIPETHFALGMAARALRRRDVALREFTEAARLFPDGSDGRHRTEEILARMRRAGGG